LSPSVSLRSVTAEDRPFLREVYASTRDAEMAVVPWNDAQKAEFLDMQWRAQTHHFDTHNPDADRSIVLLEGTPVGRLYVDRSAGHIELLDIALLPPYRSHGIGTQLMLDLIEEALRAHRPLRCHVELFNPAARLYRRLGFRPIADAGLYTYLEWAPDAPEGAAQSVGATEGRS